MTQQFAVDDRYTGASTLNPFENARNYANTVMYDYVGPQINRIMQLIGEGEGVLGLATTAISQLQNFDFTTDFPDYVPPDLTYSDVISDFSVDPLEDPSIFGVISPWNVPNDLVINLPSISDVNIPSFNPTNIRVSIPDAPPDINVAKPGPAPSTPTFTFPDELVITLPDSPDLINITIPPAPTITLPDLGTLLYPEFKDKEINTQIPWDEPDYDPQIMDAVLAQINTFFAGGSGVDPLVEENLFARGRDREDRAVRQQEMQATGEWAGRGYTAPPGMLVKRLDNIREEGTLKKLGLQREAMLKIHDDEVQNLRFAVQQGIAAESLFIQLFQARVARLFEVQRLAVEWEIQLYNISVSVFQAKLQEVQIRASVYEIQVRAALAEIEIFKALVEAESTKVQMNVALIEAYKAEIQVRESMVNMYKAQVEAVGIQAEVFRTRVEAYKATIDAYGAEIAAEAKKFDAYDSRIKGEVAKVGILEAEARAYQAEIQGIETGVKAEVAALEGEVSAIDAQIRDFEARIRSALGKADVELKQIQANVAGHGIDVQRKNLELSAEEAVSRLGIAGIDSVNRTTSEQFRNAIAEYAAKVSVIVEQLKMHLGAIESSGQLASTITAGALAAAHVGATLSGSGGLNASGTDGVSFAYNQSTQCSTNRSTTVNYQSEAAAVPDLTSCT